MEVKDVDGAAFCKMLDVWCGKELEANAEVSSLLKLGSVADWWYLHLAVPDALGRFSICCRI